MSDIEGHAFYDEEAILNFVSVTGSNPETALKYLEFAQGDASTAITFYLESGGEEVQSRAAEQSAARQSTTTNTGVDDFEPSLAEEVVRAPIRPRVEALVGPDDESPFLVQGRGIGPRIRDPFRNTQQEAADLSGEVNEETESRQDRLARLFQPPFELMFHGTFEAARQKAKDTDKYLLVSIHDPTEFPCQVLNRDLWRNDAVKEFVKEMFVFAQYGCASDQGREHISFYPFDSYPYIAIIDPLTGERIKVYRTLMEPQEFLIEVMEFMERYKEKTYGTSSGPSEPATKKNKSVLELSEEEQLELALAASMDTTGAGPSSSAAGGGDDVTEVNMTDLPLPTLFAQIKAISTPEPASLPPNQTTRLQIRFPDGRRVVRKFALQDKVRVVFESVKAEHPDIADKPFDLSNFREPLLRRLDETIEQAKVANASLSLDFI